MDGLAVGDAEFADQRAQAAEGGEDLIAVPVGLLHHVEDSPDEAQGHSLGLAAPSRPPSPAAFCLPQARPPGKEQNPRLLNEFVCLECQPVDTTIDGERLANHVESFGSDGG